MKPNLESFVDEDSLRNSMKGSMGETERSQRTDANTTRGRVTEIKSKHHDSDNSLSVLNLSGEVFSFKKDLRATIINQFVKRSPSTTQNS